MASQPKKVQSHSDTWTLRLNRGETNCNVAKFEEIWLTAGGTKRKAPRAPVDDPRFFIPPCYMYRQQEVEEHSEDEDFEGPEKMDAFDRPAFKKRVVNQRAIQWVLEDKRDFSKRGGGLKYVGNKTEQTSKYAIFRTSSTQRDVIEVTPIHEWWYFKRPPRDEGKMTLKEAEELMKKQEHFVGPLSLANKIEKIIETDEAARGAVQAEGAGKYGDLDREDTQVLKESGLAPDDIDKGGGDRGGAGGAAGGGGNDEESQDEEGDVVEEDEMPSDAGGEDDDFGDEVRSDDEEEVGNDDANAEGGTLHQDDEDLKDSEKEYGSDEDEEISELRKLSRSVNADGEERKDDLNDSGPSNANGDPVRTSMTLAAGGNPAASSTSPSAGGEKPAGTAGAGDEPGSAAGGATSTGKRPASAMAGDGADSRGVADGARAGGVSAEGNSTKRAKKPKKEINQENVVATLKLQGGRLSSKDVLGQFMSALKKSDKKSAITKLREILNKVATKVDDAIHGQVWVLKQHFS